MAFNSNSGFGAKVDPSVTGASTRSFLPPKNDMGSMFSADPSNKMKAAVPESNSKVGSVGSDAKTECKIEAKPFGSSVFGGSASTSFASAPSFALAAKAGAASSSSPAPGPFAVAAKAGAASSSSPAPGPFAPTSFPAKAPPSAISSSAAFGSKQPAPVVAAFAKSSSADKAPVSQTSASLPLPNKIAKSAPPTTAPPVDGTTEDKRIVDALHSTGNTKCLQTLRNEIILQQMEDIHKLHRAVDELVGWGTLTRLQEATLDNLDTILDRVEDELTHTEGELERITLSASGASTLRTGAVEADLGNGLTSAQLERAWADNKDAFLCAMKSHRSSFEELEKQVEKLKHLRLVNDELCETANGAPS